MLNPLIFHLASNTESFAMKNGAEVSLVKLLQNHVSVAKEGEVFEQKITAASFFRVHEQPKMTCTILYTSWVLTGQKVFFETLYWLLYSTVNNLQGCH